MHSILQDLRYALRQLRKSPGFTFTAILSLALGIGATTAVFSVIYAILVNPYPYANPDRMVHMRLIDSDGHERGFGTTPAQWQQIRKSPVVEDAFIANEWNLTVTGHDFPEDVSADLVSSNAFNFLGVPAALGRGLQPSDALDGQDPQPVVVLSYKFWQRHFLADPSVIGKTMQMVRKTYTIVGVASPRFTWDDADVYTPQKITADPLLGFYCGVRLKPGVTHDQANAALQPLLEQFAKETPKHFPKETFRVHVIGLNDDFLKQLGPSLALLFAAVALLLAIGCGNVSILLLARGTSRQQEFAVRSAIGAGRRRLIAQLLTESLLLSVTGAALGVGLAYVSLAKIVALLPPYAFPHEAAIHINLPVLVFSVAIALLTGVIFGLWPALQLSRPDVSQSLQSGTRKVAGSVRGRRTLALLIGGQITLTLLMLSGAGAALQGFLRLANVSLGYDPHNIMSVGIPVHENTYGTWADRANHFEQLRAAVAAVPGVRIAAISTNATPPSNGSDTKFEILGKPATQDQSVRANFVSPGYFTVLGIALSQGSIWDESENHNAAPVIVINQSLARLYFPNGDALGHSIKIPFPSEPPFNLVSTTSSGWLRIVGVIVDKRDDGLRNPIKPEAFVPYTLWLRMGTQILVKSSVPPLTLMTAIRKQIAAVDSDQQAEGDPQDLEHWIMNQPEYASIQFISWLFGIFAALALVLAAVGLYSVVSYSVAQRTNEFGIRLALGAQREHVLQIVFRSVLGSVGVGVALGLVLTLVLNRILVKMAVEGSWGDATVVLSATAVLCAVALLACAIPARRASRIDPMVALRYD
jgi:putative ABC transport system permease protein